LAGIDLDSPDPPGGRIGRDAQGRPDGMLFEGSAMALVESLVPPPAAADLDRALRDAFPHAWRVGLTTLHDMDGGEAFGAYERLRGQDSLGVRVVEYLPVEALDDLPAAADRWSDRWLRVGGIKVFVDGALGTRTAAVLAPYAGEPANLGVLAIDEPALRQVAKRAAAAGLPLAVHAIGDRANRVALDALEQAGPPGEGAPPHRIEHAQLVDPDDIGRYGVLGIVASMQPIHATQDAQMADRYWGKRCETAYAWRSLLDKGAVLAFGSDCPVEDMNPMLGIHAAVTRRTVDGRMGPQGWYPAQRLTVAEAVYAYTAGAAYAGGMDDWLGSLMPGKLADLVVLSQDIFECTPMDIAGTHVLATMIGGRIVYGDV
jgi:predicted amidohydrolase YtcJ